MKASITSIAIGTSMLLSMVSPTLAYSATTASPGEVHGLASEYYTFKSSDAKYSFTDLKAKSIDSGVNTDDFTSKLKVMTGQSQYVSVRWTGQIKAQATGETTFYYYGDNGIRLWVNGQQIINHWKNDWDVDVKSASINLVAGQKYSFVMEYFQATGGASIKLSWSAPNFEKKEITSSCFYLSDDYSGAYVSAVDTSSADTTYPGLSGVLGIEGNGLSGSSVEVLDGTGYELTPALYCTPLSSSTNADIIVNLPQSLTPGTYLFMITNGIFKIWYPFNIGYDFGDSIPRSEYPRPDWERDQWLNLNGKWNFDFDENVVGDSENWETSHAYSQQINVPYPWESSLSGVGKTDYLGVAWYQRDFSLDSSWTGKEVILNFGAVDWRCKIWVNGSLVGTHEGGYSQFNVDITKYVKIGQNTSNSITVRVEDYDQSDPDTSGRDQLIGKQGYDTPAGYTHTSGIWQTVYLTAQNSATYIKSAQANPDIDNSKVTFNVDVYNAGKAGDSLTLKYAFNGTRNDKANGSSFSGEESITLPAAGENKITVTADIPNEKLWDTENPNLYNGTFELDDDSAVIDKVSTYFGQRKVTEEKYGSNAYQYVYLNNKPVYLSGALMQGFWPSGIYTAPAASSYESDIQDMKNDGFNMLRMHMKIEDPMFYYYADKLGMIVFQDMPWGQDLNADDAQPKIGRTAYQEALTSELERDYNHPSIVALLLFNENWGVHHTGDTDTWMTSLYNTIKNIHSNMLVENMSGASQIQPTDLVDFHAYSSSVAATKTIPDAMNKNYTAGSSYNFQSPYAYQAEPWLNTEYSGLGWGDGDRDLSWSFKYQTTILRLYQRMNGVTYTEPYDIEYERNGLFNYNRTGKLFPYNEVAYGGDMTMKSLTQPNFIGFYNDPVVTLKPGDTFTGSLGAINWSGNTYSGAKIKWRFDATDVYGNSVSTGISGEIPLDYTPYTMVNKTFSFKLPATSNTSKLVGTVTAWIEDENGNDLAKNFTNIVVTDGTATPEIEQLGTNEFALRQPSQGNVGDSATYEYTIPNEMNTDSLKNLRIMAELSSYKANETQTSESEQAPSDVTVSVNGHEVTTVTLPDDPRDIRGTLTLSNNSPSATDFGYLLNLKIPDSMIGSLKAELKNSKKITVTYQIKNNAKNQNGLRFYGETEGRYAVTPMVLLNAPDNTAADVSGSGSSQVLSGIPSMTNYSVEADVTPAGASSDTAGLTARVSENSGYYASVTQDGTVVTLSKLDGTVIKSVSGQNLGTGMKHLKITLFDSHILVYANNGVVPVIDTYDDSYSSGQSGVKDTAGGSSFTEITQSPESYDLGQITDEEAVSADQASLSLGDTSALVSDLTLPSAGDNGTTITWKSANSSLISDGGVISRPPYGFGNQSTTLTATIKKGDTSAAKTFTVTVMQAEAIVAEYEFENDSSGIIKDSVSNNDGHYTDACTINDAQRNSNVLSLNGNSDSYVKLPDGITNNLKEMTVAAWVKCGSGSVNQRIFQFGKDANDYLMLAVTGSHSIQASVKNSSNGGAIDQQVNANFPGTGAWHHVAVTMTKHVLSLYVDGTFVGSNKKLTTSPSDLGNTTENFIGKSQYPYSNYSGMVDDFRIYGYAMTSHEIENVMGNKVSGIMVNKSTLDLFVGSSGKIAAAEMPSGTIGANITWSTSNSSVATVGTDGNVKAIAAGTATITASCGSYSATCSVTVSLQPSSSTSSTASNNTSSSGASSEPASTSQGASSAGSSPADISSSVSSSGGVSSTGSSSGDNSSGEPLSSGSSQGGSASSPSGLVSSEGETEEQSDSSRAQSNISKQASNVDTSDTSHFMFPFILLLSLATVACIVANGKKKRFK